MTNKTIINDKILNLLKNIIRRSEIIERQSGTRNLVEIDLAMDDVRLLYRELEMFRKITEEECKKGNETISGIVEHTGVPERSDAPKPKPVICITPLMQSVPETMDAPKPEPVLFQDQPAINIEPAIEEQKTDMTVSHIAEKKGPVQSLPREPELKQEIKFVVAEKPPIEVPFAAVESPKVDNPTNNPKPTIQTSPKPVVEKVSQEKQILGDKYSGNGNSVYERLAKIKEDKSIGTRMQVQPIENLKTVIGVNEKFLFVNELFNGDLQGYNDSIQKLNTYPSIHDAFEYLNQLTTLYSWDGERSSDTIEKFANLVQRRYMRGS